MSWLLGVVVLAALVVFVLHFGDFTVFLAAVRHANPLWIAAAVAVQAATYACAAAIWFRVLKRAGAVRSFPGLLTLALLELFANQALPTGGISGSVIVMRGLERRGVAPPTAMTALLIAALSYYAAFLLIGLLAFVLLWNRGDLNAAWLSLSAVFAVAMVAFAVAVLLLARWGGRAFPAMLTRWRPFKRLATILGQVQGDIVSDVRLTFGAVVLQAAIFVLDAATLWLTCRAVGLQMDAGSVFMSFVLASIVAMLSLIPLGLGTFEGVCVAMLHVMGAGLEASLAATLMLRGLTLWLPMLPGLWLIRRETAMAARSRHE